MTMAGIYFNKLCMFPNAAVRFGTERTMFR